MIHQFVFENYKSFRNETILDFIASDLNEHPDDVYLGKILKTIAIYGANASGKTQVIDAIASMKKMIMHSDNPKMREELLREIKPFMFDGNQDDIRFEMLFSLNEWIYQYGFDLRPNLSISKEFLSCDRGEGFHDLFAFDTTKSLYLDESLKSYADLIGMKNEFTLILTLLSNLELTSVYRWFMGINIFDMDEDLNDSLTQSHLRSIIENEVTKQELLVFVNSFDLGIDDFIVRDDSIVFGHLDSVHQRMIEMPLSSESAGTLKMIALYLCLKSVLNEGGVLLCDELNAKLHPLLLRYIVILFHQSQSQAQLIFTTHDATTLTQDLFRRDEIWFTEKDARRMSTLFSLVDFGKDVDAPFDEQWLLGKFGAIPFIKDMKLFGGHDHEH